MRGYQDNIINGEVKWDGMAYSAYDMTAYIELPAEHYNSFNLSPTIMKFATLAMLKVSTHRDKFPVATLGRLAPIAFTAGHRTVAGSLAFNTINSEAFSEVLHMIKDSAKINIRPDAIPPFNISLNLINDAGVCSVGKLIGVTLLDGGYSVSVDELAITEVYSFMAKDIQMIEDVSNESDVISNDVYDSMVSSVTSVITKPTIHDDGDTLRTASPPNKSALNGGNASITIDPSSKIINKW